MIDQPVILYVEDDDQSRDIMHLLLEIEMGLEQVYFFANSEDFENRVLSLDPRPEVIMLDIHMAPITGFEMLAVLRGLPEYAHTPVIALTASVMNEEVQQLRSSGFNGVIAKPINLDIFPNILEKVLRGEAVWNIVD